MGAKFFSVDVVDPIGVNVSSIKEVLNDSVFKELPLKGCELVFCEDINWTDLGKRELHEGTCDIRVRREKQPVATLKPIITYGPTYGPVNAGKHQITGIELFVPKNDMKKLKRMCR